MLEITYCVCHLYQTDTQWCSRLKRTLGGGGNLCRQTLLGTIYCLRFLWGNRFFFNKDFHSISLLFRNSFSFLPCDPPLWYFICLASELLAAHSTMANYYSVCRLLSIMCPLDKDVSYDLPIFDTKSDLALCYFLFGSTKMFTTTSPPTSCRSSVSRRSFPSLCCELRNMLIQVYYR